MLDPFKPYLHARLAAGHGNATALLGEITSRDTPAATTPFAATCCRYATSKAAVVAALSSLAVRPAVRRVAGWITGLPGRLDPEDGERLGAIRARCPELDAAVRQVAGFGRMIKDLSGDRDTLVGWMLAVDADLPELRSFTGG